MLLTYIHTKFLDVNTYARYLVVMNFEHHAIETI